MKFSNLISAAILTAITIIPGTAQNKLTVFRNGIHSIEINLENSQPVAGMQFRITGTTDIEFISPERASRTTDPEWLVATSKPNDSTVVAVIVNSNLSELRTGSGPILRISFASHGVTSKSTSRISIVNAMIANARAESLGVVLQNLEFSTQTEPASFVFGRNFPNPFNPTTHLSYKLHKPAQVRLAVYDVAGREISRLVDRFQNAEDFSVLWEGTDDAGRPVPSGVYFALLKVDNSVATQKMILAK
ncbi:MAG: T9SS type A sorting domain-containing protein [Bacteroidota bacterium]